MRDSRHREIELPDTEFADCPEMGAPTFTTSLPGPRIDPRQLTRRRFLRRTADVAVAAGAADFLSYLLRFGDPNRGKAWASNLDSAARQAATPRFLIYWYIEGGWESYDMFSPLITENNVIHRLPFDQISQERYRVLHFGEPGYTITKAGPIRYGYLAEGGKPLFPEMAVLSSMHTGTFHSGERLRVHMGSYDLELQADREPDERSVMQAFSEAYGQPYVMPNLSWHWWLSDGELNEVQYTGRKGYYANLGPAWAHTLYAGTPANLRDFLMRIQSNANDVVNCEIERFLDDAHHRLIRDSDIETVKSYNAARDVYADMASAGKGLDAARLSRLFTDVDLKARFKVKPADELITYQSVNGNKARTKFSPATNVQAMMTYEMMRAGLSCSFFIETRDIRRFDSHYSRRALWQSDGVTPIGQPDQSQMMQEQLWDPLLTLVDLLKTTPHRATGRSLWDYTTIVLTSEFGRTIHGDVNDFLKDKSLTDVDRKKKIDDQDISQHWRVTSAAFLGPNVNGNTQWGKIGAKTMQAIPLLPDGRLCPDFDPVTGEGPRGWDTDQALIAKYDAMTPNHGDVYATALALCGIPKKSQTGRNDRNPLPYILKAS